MASLAIYYSSKKLLTLNVDRNTRGSKGLEWKQYRGDRR
jgi:hypothetical protein